MQRFFQIEIMLLPLSHNQMILHIRKTNRLSAHTIHRLCVIYVNIRKDTIQGSGARLACPCAGRPCEAQQALRSGQPKLPPVRQLRGVVTLHSQGGRPLPALMRMPLLELELSEGLPWVHPVHAQLLALTTQLIVVQWCPVP